LLTAVDSTKETNQTQTNQIEQRQWKLSFYFKASSTRITFKYQLNSSGVIYQ
jgi:hypothetical protein